MNSEDPQMILNPIDEIGGQTLQHIEKMERFNRWMSAVLLPYIRGEVLEVGCGTGNITKFLLAAGRTVTGMDLCPEYVDYARGRLASLGSFEGHAGDITGALPPGLIDRQFDTVVMLNVLEHLAQEDQALQNIATLCRPGGRFVCLVPAYPWLFGSLDVHLGHHRRYDRRSLHAVVSRAGFTPVKCFHFNAPGILGWWVNGRVLRKAALAPGQLALYDRLVPIFRALEAPLAGCIGQSLIIIGRRDGPTVGRNGQ